MSFWNENNARFLRAQFPASRERKEDFNICQEHSRFKVTPLVLEKNPETATRLLTYLCSVREYAAKQQGRRRNSRRRRKAQSVIHALSSVFQAFRNERTMELKTVNVNI